MLRKSIKVFSFLIGVSQILNINFIDLRNISFLVGFSQMLKITFINLCNIIFGMLLLIRNRWSLLQIFHFISSLHNYDHCVLFPGMVIRLKYIS